MSTHSRYLLLLLLVSCKSDDKDVDLMPDASVDTDTPANNVVTIESFDEVPNFVMYRDGDRAWQPAPEIPGGYEMHIHDAYQLIAVCGDQHNGYDIGIEAATFQESGGMTWLPCDPTSFDTPSSVATVTGTMMQPGTAIMNGAQATGTTSNWSFQLTVPTGATDLLAIAGEKMTIRRNVNVVQPTTMVATVDAATTMQAVPITLNGIASGDTVETHLFFFASNVATVISGTGSVLKTVPASLLVPTDVQVMFVGVPGANTTYRSVYGRYTTGSSTTFTLLPRLNVGNGITLGVAKATWSTIPTGSVRISMSGGNTYVHSLATSGWLGTKTELAIDTKIPGFQSAWLPAAYESRTFEVLVREGDATLSTAVFF